MPNPLVEMLKQELSWFNRVWDEDRQRPQANRIFPEQDNLYPIPFFGDIRHAEVLTIALNPAHDEFDNREWPRRQNPAALSATALTSRLLHYFDLPEPTPHSFFVPFTKMLLPTGASYLTNAAHIDLSSLPTFKPSGMNDGQRSVFAETVSRYASKLNAVLRLATNKKLILVADFRVRNGPGGYFSVWSLLCEHCPVFARYANQETDAFPVFRGGSVGALTATVLRLRYDIRAYLETANPLTHPAK